MQKILVDEVQFWDGGDRHNFAFYLKAGVHTEQQIQATYKHSLVISNKSLYIFDNIADYKESQDLLKAEKLLKQFNEKELELIKQYLTLKN